MSAEYRKLGLSYSCAVDLLSYSLEEAPNRLTYSCAHRKCTSFRGIKNWFDSLVLRKSYRDGERTLAEFLSEIQAYPAGVVDSWMAQRLGVSGLEFT